MLSLQTETQPINSPSTYTTSPRNEQPNVPLLFGTPLQHQQAVDGGCDGCKGGLGSSVLRLDYTDLCPVLGKKTLWTKLLSSQTEWQCMPEQT